MVRLISFVSVILIGIFAMSIGSSWRKQGDDVEYRVLKTNAKPVRLATSAEYPQLLSSRFCTEYQIYLQEGFDTYGFPFRRNNKCLMFEGDGIISVKLQSISPLGSMPILMASPARPSASAPITILLVGGPQDSIFNGLDNNPASLIRALARATGGPVLVPGYYGTAHRRVYPLPDLDVAKSELGPWLAQIERDWPERRISVVGFSAGSLLAFDLFKQHGLPTVLVSAPPVSIAELYRLRNVDFIHGSAAQKARRGAVIAFDIIDGRAVYAGVREAPMADLSRAFFGRHYAGRTWTRELAELSTDDRACLRVIFGARDETIAKEVFFAEGLHRLVQTVVIPNVRHTSENDNEAQAFASAIAGTPDCPAMRHRMDAGRQGSN